MSLLEREKDEEAAVGGEVLVQGYEALKAP